jgi:chromosome segregation ATPase
MCIRMCRNLSGGEKACATLALLLAMQASNESPFLVMDEFDVRTTYTMSI